MQIDETGRAFYQVDDKRYAAGRSGVDSAFTGSVWPNGIVYYQFSSEVNSYERNAWREGAAAWSTRVPSLTFVESTGSGNYIYVQRSNVNDSYVGMVGGAQVMNLAGWLRGLVAHEIGHALGLEHEQSRSDRGSYVTIHYDNIEPGQERNFNALSTINYGSYDFQSIMHYDRVAFSKNGLNTIEPLPPYASHLYTMGYYDDPSAADAAGMIERYKNAIPLGTAVDAPGLTWRTDFHTKWLGQAATTHDGTDAASSPPRTHNGWSGIMTDITGPGILTFWWKVSSEAGRDYLGFSINEQQPSFLPAISGELDWRQQSIRLASGVNRLRWSYVKDDSGSAGLDAGWLDEVSFVPRRKSDFNGDGFGDFVWQNTRTGERVMWLLRDGLYQSGYHLQTIAPEWRIAGTGDLNADGHADFTWQNTRTGEHVVWFLRNAQYESGFYFDTIPPEWQIATSADLNGDDHSDFVWQNSRTGENVIWLLRNGRFQSGFYFDTIPPEWQIASAADLNADGHADFVWQNTRTGEHVCWFLRNGRFQSGFYFDTLPPEWRIAGATDLNNDAHADLVWQNINTGERVVWFLRNGRYQRGFYMQAVDREWDLCVR